MSIWSISSKWESEIYAKSKKKIRKECNDTHVSHKKNRRTKGASTDIV